MTKKRPTESKSKTYRKPKFSCYGKLADITQGGSGMTTESNGGQELGRQKP